MHPGSRAHLRPLGRPPRPPPRPAPAPAAGAHADPRPRRAPSPRSARRPRRWRAPAAAMNKTMGGSYHNLAALAEAEFGDARQAGPHHGRSGGGGGGSDDEGGGGGRPMGVDAQSGSALSLDSQGGRTRCGRRREGLALAAALEWPAPATSLSTCSAAAACRGAQPSGRPAPAPRPQPTPPRQPPPDRDQRAARAPAARGGVVGL
jgi:hypothetical protein